MYEKHDYSRGYQMNIFRGARTGERHTHTVKRIPVCGFLHTIIVIIIVLFKYIIMYYACATRSVSVLFAGSEFISVDHV